MLATPARNLTVLSGSAGGPVRFGPGDDLMTTPELTGMRGRRVLVVGGSSGIGRAVALAAGAAGSSVAVAARRSALVDRVAAETRAAGAPSAHGLVCDVADPEAALALGPRAAELLGGLDAVVYSAGTAVLAPLATVTADDWRFVLETNVIGAALVLSGALEPLRRAGDDDTPPTFVVLSTHTTPRPWPGLVSYAASKAALDTMVRGLRDEEPWLRVVDVVVGNTITGFADGWDPVLAGSSFERWIAGGYFDGVTFQPEEMAAVVLGAIADPTGPEDINVVRSA